jgi:threonine synthase
MSKSGMDFRTLDQKGFVDLLPITELSFFPNLRIGNTPLYKIDGTSGNSFPFDLYLKDDSQNPTFSLKDRASALVSAYAREKQLNVIVAASTGNAGSSIAGICASQGQRSVVLVPASAPAAKLTQMIMYGAVVVPVDGTYDDAFDLSVQISNEYGWYSRNTAYNPLTVEGKKTVSLELFRDMNYQIPDRIFVPVGDGVIISGVYKGFEDLLKLNLIDKIPVIVAVQAEGSCNLIRNLNTGFFRSENSRTIADSISVDYPRNYYMAREFNHHYHGAHKTVTDIEILNASKKLAASTGIFAEPAAAAAFAGFQKYYAINRIEQGSRNVVLLTGSGLKDIGSVQPILSLPEPVQPDLETVKRFLKL